MIASTARPVYVATKSRTADRSEATMVSTRSLPQDDGVVFIHIQLPSGQHASLLTDDQLPIESVTHAIGQLLTLGLADTGVLPPACMGHLALTLGAYAEHEHSDVALNTPSAGRLAAWQLTRATTMLAPMTEAVPLDEVAHACGLSLGHFNRAFKTTTGATPRRWQRARRLECSLQLMQDRSRSLADIALECGFAEQSHFTHAFSKAMGVSPGLLRSQMISAPELESATAV